MCDTTRKSDFFNVNVSISLLQLWVCDSGGAATQGVWLFTLNPATSLFEPASALSRVWSSAVCLDIAAQYELYYTIYFVGGAAGANSVYRMPASSPYTATVSLRMRV